MPHEQPDLAGMTLNERLWVTGLSDEFERARKRRDRERVVELLREVEVTDVEWTAREIMKPWLRAVLDAVRRSLSRHMRA